jgi:hypothetical protein
MKQLEDLGEGRGTLHQLATLAIADALIAIAEGKAAELRPCNFFDRERGPSAGHFHHWTPDGYSAKVEHEDGQIAFVLAHKVRFLDRKSAKEPETGDEPEFKCPECGKLHTPEMTYDPEVCGAEPL